jgi:hypothetical protein
MTHWTLEDSLKFMLVGAISVSFLLVEGPALTERLSFDAMAQEVQGSAAPDPDQPAHQQVLELERRYPMIDVLGYGHGLSKDIPMTYVIFGVVDTAAVESREG